MLTGNSQSFSALSLLAWPRHLVPTCARASEETVHALHSLAAVVHALRPDALAARVMKPAVFGSSHRLAVLFTLTDGHAVVEVDHCAHALLVVVAGVDAVSRDGHVLLLGFKRL